MEDTKRWKFCHFLYHNLDIMVVSESDLDELFDVGKQSLLNYGYYMIETSNGFMAK